MVTKTRMMMESFDKDALLTWKENLEDLQRIDPKGLKDKTIREAWKRRVKETLDEVRYYEDKLRLRKILKSYTKEELLNLLEDLGQTIHPEENKDILVYRVILLLDNPGTRNTLRRLREKVHTVSKKA